MTDRLPHICFLAPNAFPLLANDASIPFAGGAEVQQVAIAKGLVKRGYTVSMICLDFGQDDECEIEGVTVHRAFSPRDGVPVLRFIWPRLTSIWKCMSRAGADIYYHRAGSMLTGVMVAFCRKHGKKSVFAIAGYASFRFNRDRLLYEYGIKHADRLVVQNHAQAEFVKKKIGRDSLLVPSVYHAEVLQSAASPQYVLWVGMIRQVKRPDIFLDIVQSLPELSFVMVGGPSIGELPLYEAISARAEKLMNLNFAGFVPYKDVDAYFNGALLFVNTSDSEGFPNTFLQSWARGIPTVSFADSGARMNGQPVGMLAETAEEMIKVISDLVNDTEATSSLGRAAKQYMELNHSPNRVLDLYEELFRDMA
jgi:glycosyltransferase involved in cell wall biosynthesis